MAVPRFTASLAVALAAVVLASTAHGGRPRTDPADAEACARLRHANAQLRQELALAASKEFYLRLDAGRGRLALVLRGVTLAEHRITRLDVGEPRIGFARRGLPEAWDESPVSGGELDPPRERDRVELVVSESPASDPRPASETPPSAPPIPARAEESYSVPSRYRIAFREGVTVEIRSPGGARNRGALQRLVDAVFLWAHDRTGALRQGGKDRVRLRVDLPDEDAAALYRSLPPAVRLVIVGPTGK
jgi:hypothetical protein